MSAPPVTALPRLACSVVTDAAALRALRPEWEVLLQRSVSNEPMLSPAWLLTWWDVFGPLDGRALRAVLFRDGERLVGLAPLLLRRHRYRPGLPFRRLEPLASGEPIADAICSDYLNVLAERGAEESVAGAFAQVLASGALGGWDELVLPMMDGDGATPELLAGACRAAGLHARITVTDAAPYLPLPPTWDAYLKTLTGKHRYSIVSALRDFDAWAGGDARLERVTAPADLAKGKQVLTGLHHERWDGGDGGVFRSPRFLAFHGAVMPRLLELGALQLCWLTVRGEPVAAHYSIVWNEKVYFYQCGRRLDVPPRVRPGIVLLGYAIRDAIEAGRREFDFLAGDTAYKRRLASAARPLVQLRVARPSLRETTRRAVEHGQGWARRLRDAGRAALARWRTRLHRPPAPPA